MRTVPLSFMVVLSLAAGFGARPANLYAQAPSASAPQTQTTTPPPAQKKVWTNDDIDQIHNEGGGGISVMGPSTAPTDTSSTQKSSAAPAAGAKPAKGPALPKEKDPEWYREQLTPLYKALDRINDQIAAAQSAISGDTRGDAGVSMNARAPAGTPQEQLVALQKEQADVQGKIDALLDLARHNDIPPGDLR